MSIGQRTQTRPDEAFTQRLTAVFAEARAERVTFHNPLQSREFTKTIYLARTGGAPELYAYACPSCGLLE